ncbi:MAG: hypothetical protein V1743_02750 [Nanoarchaeota archaeon]
MEVKLLHRTKRDEQVKFHFREIEIDGVLFQLEYCSGPSLVGSGRTDQLYMQVTVRPPTGNDIELYTLKRYPVSPLGELAEHIVYNKETREVRPSTDTSSLQTLVYALIQDQEGRLMMLESFPSIVTEPLKPGTVRASDWDLIHMYLKHV